MDEVTSRPDGYLTTVEFAALVGHTPQTISFAYRKGQFDPAKVLLLKPRTLLIHESQVQVYKDLRKPKPRRPVVESSAGFESYLELPDLSSLSDEDAKLRKEQIKLVKEQVDTQRRILELNQAQNKLVEYAEVAKLWEDVALQVRQTILAVVPRLAARLANISDVHECNETLKKELTEALATLAENHILRD
jgi:hypothetical protein